MSSLGCHSLLCLYNDRYKVSLGPYVIFHFFPKVSGSCVLLRHPWLSGNRHSRLTLDWPSIDTLATLHWHHGWHAVDISADSWIIFNPWIWVSQHSPDYWLTVDQVSTECGLSINWYIDWVLIKMLIKGIDQEYWLTLDHGCLINTHDPGVWLWDVPVK